MERHPYFRMLNKLGFLLRGHGYAGDAAEVRVAACEYLDSVYLRLSLAGAMPEVAPAMAAMEFERVGRKVRTAAPEQGRNGVVDLEDLEAWKAVADPFRDLGFTLLRQLGMGEFGRVYEALNDNSPNYPGRVALKVDRIVGKKKNAILEAEEAMVVGRALARVPHLMRLYDTGKLKGQRFTYHVLQLINGDTLDNLVGVTGTEHASVSRPPSARASDGEAEAEYNRAVSARGGELWRRQRMALPFTHALSPAMVLDLLTSVLLWMEGVHAVGYAINDLKNGNLMMSRRGQLKGIDLDSYAPVHSPKDKVTDFMFLAVSVILLLFSAPVANRGRNVPWEELIESEARLRTGLNEAWPFGNVELLSDGRVSREQLINVLVDLVHRSRHLIYTKRPELFSEDIARMVNLKHELLIEELVID
jgi:serine/threonine protein kinase